MLVIRALALSVALATVAALPASAQDAGRGAGSTQTADPSPTPDPRSDAPGRSQMLTPDEQQQIAKILMAEGAPSDDAGLDKLEAGAVIPRTTTLRPVPAEVVVIAPGYADYSYVALEGRICIVDPQTLVIMAVLPTPQ